MNNQYLKNGARVIEQGRSAIMSKQKSDRIQQTMNKGLASANQGNPFWSKKDAMSNINLARRNKS